MRVEEVLIIDKKDFNNGNFLFTFKTKYIAGKAIPGQFIMLYFDSFMLPRPYSICHVEGDNLSILFQVKGKGTLIHSKYAVGDRLRMLGSLGNGFPAFFNQKILLVGGGLGIAPLLFYTQFYKHNKYQIIYGVRDQKYLNYPIDKKRYEKVYEILGFPIPYIKTFIDYYDIVLMCGPSLMMNKIIILPETYNKEIYYSTESHMACGVGACLGCVQEIDGKYQRVCKEGPVFHVNR